MSEWPKRITTATSAVSTLERLWIAVAEGGLDAPRDSQLEARALFGSARRSLTPDGCAPFKGGPSWSCSWLSPRWLYGAFSQGDPFLPGMLPATLWTLPESYVVEDLAGEYAIAHLVDVDGTPLHDPALWASQIVTDAARSDERPRIGIKSPPYASTPAGTHAAALATVAARAIADALTLYTSEEPLPPARLGTALRREATALVAFADEIEPSIDSTSRTWLPQADAWISTVRAPANGASKIVPASLRADGRNTL